MTIPSRRALNLAGFLICSALMAYALYAQHQLMLEPCPLCILQRFAVIGLGVFFLLGAIHNPAGGARFVYATGLGLSALLGVIVAGRHVWLQELPADEVPACGPGLDYMWENFPLADVLNMVFKGSGECAGIDWQFLGLSMPMWVLINVVLIGAVGIWNSLRKQ